MKILNFKSEIDIGKIELYNYLICNRLGFVEEIILILDQLTIC